LGIFIKDFFLIIKKTDMVEQRVVDYIKEQLSNGFTKEQIKQGLLSQNWEEYKIDEAMQLVPQKSNSLNSINKNVPGLIKFFAVITYIESVLGIISGIALILGGSILSNSSFAPVFLSLLLSSFPLGLFIALGVLSIGFSILNFFIARGLWMGKKWARTIYIIFIILAILYSIYILITTSLISGLLSMILSLLIGWYFIFNKKVKQAFA
jgi:hypothetical protein